MRDFITLVESYQILSERKMDIVDVLAKYKDDPSIFFQFSEIEKFGINPRYRYSITPVGIYGYPIKSGWKKILSHTFEYGANRDYIHIFKLKPGSNILYVSNYSLQDYRNDIKKLLAIFDKSFPKLNDSDDSDDLEMFREHLVRDLSSNEKEKKNVVFKKAHVRNLLHTSRELAKFFSYHNKNDLKYPSTLQLVASWNAVLRSLGYDGIVDNGHGQITEDIPAQAVFFSIKPVQLIETALNAKKHDNADVENASEDLKSSIIAVHGENAISINSYPEEKQFKLILKNRNLLKFVKNPSYKLQSAIVKVHPSWIQYFKRPYLEIQQQALDDNFLQVYEYVPFRLVLARISKEPELIRKMYLSSKMEVAILKLNPEYFKYIRHPGSPVKDLYKSITDRMTIKNNSDNNPAIKNYRTSV